MTIQPPKGYYDLAEVCVSITPVVEVIATKVEPKLDRKVEGSLREHLGRSFNFKASRFDFQGE